MKRLLCGMMGMTVLVLGLAPAAGAGEKTNAPVRIAASHTPVLDGPDTKLVIGNMSRLPFINWSDMFFNGLVDEVRLYRRALSEEEILSLQDVQK